MMIPFRITILIFSLVVLALGASAQPVATEAVEKYFETKRSSFKLERFQEDREIIAGSPIRFEYLHYLDKDNKHAKMRIIEREDKPGASLKVDDYFFVDGDLRLVRLYFFMNSSRLAALKEGAIVPLLTGEHIELKDGKLLRWNALGKEIPTSDRRWADKQTSVLSSYRLELYFYNEFKKPKQ